MNKNKGFIGIGLILAIVLGIVVVGGGAYYLGKSKGENKEVKISNNIVPQENQDAKNESINTEVKNTIPVVLPEPYISSSNWPPIISRYPGPYSCELRSLTKSNDGGSSVVEPIMINGKKYCKTNELYKVMNHWVNLYTYVLANGNDTRSMNFKLINKDCDEYGNSLNGGDIEYKKCQTAQSNFNLDKIVDSFFVIDSSITISSCSANGINITFPKNDFKCSYDRYDDYDKYDDPYLIPNYVSLDISYDNVDIIMGINKFKNQSVFNDGLPSSAEYESVDMNYNVNGIPAQYYKNWKGDEGGSTIIIPSKLVKIHIPTTITETTQSIYDQIISSIKIK